jgi:hypothetical protein
MTGASRRVTHFVMADSKRKPKPGLERPKVGPHPDDLAAGAFDGADDLREVDAEAYLRWLETGEGDDPWPESSS